MTMMSLNSGKGDGCDLISPRTKDRNLGVCFTFEKFSSLSVGMKKKRVGGLRECLVLQCVLPLCFFKA